jgi:hypothetical protein
LIGIAVNDAGDIFVAVHTRLPDNTHTDGKIMRFTSSGVFVQDYVTFTAPDGPWFLEFDALGNLYVVTSHTPQGNVAKLWRIDGLETKTLIQNLDSGIGLAVPMRFVP